MIIGPNAVELLDALAHFLARELRPAVSDPALAFRTLIASAIATGVAGELRGGATVDAAQRARLAALGFDDPGASTHELEEQLVTALRQGAAPTAEVWAHAKTSLAEMLDLTNPRFDRRSELP